MKKVFRTSLLSLLIGMASATAFAADPAEFVESASAKGIAEVEAGELALKNSDSADVKAFAQMMIDDHTKANETLKSIAQEKNLEVSTEATAVDKTKAMILENRDASFDRSYANNQVAAHKEAITLFKDEAENGKDADLKKFAATALPKLEAHLTKAQALAKKYGGDAKP